MFRIKYTRVWERSCVPTDQPAKAKPAHSSGFPDHSTHCLGHHLVDGPHDASDEVMAIEDHSRMVPAAIDSGAVDNVTHPTDTPKDIKI